MTLLDILQSGVPARSDTVLVTSYGYNDAGMLDTVTDPRGITSKYFYDSLGQTLFTVAAWDGSYDPTTGALPSSSDANQTTGYTYNAVGQTQTMTAVMPFGQNSQTTGYVYNSNGTLALVKYPDPTTGTESSNASAQNSFTYNNLGQVLTMTDQNGTMHTYTYDTLGRQISDAVTIASGNPQNIDSSILRIETSYNSQSLVEYITSYNAATGGSVVNQVQNVYNGLGQLITQYQEHNGEVNPATTPKVQYAYDTLSYGSRLISMTYPDGTILSYSYGTTGSLNDTISRLTFLVQSGTTVESYVYLGYSTVVMRLHPEDGVDLTYIKIGNVSSGDAGDKYTGLDRFGRIIDQRWIDASGADVDRYQYTYDRDSNVTAKTNVLNSAFSETYSYDNLNRLIATYRDGVDYQSWDLDALGNMQSVTTDGTTENRTNNNQNQLTSVGSNMLTYDNNGNTTTDDLGRTLIYDAWNRLISVQDSDGTLLNTYTYDGLNHRITESPYELVTDLYYSAQWQVIEEHSNGNWKYQYVWSPVYVNAMVSRNELGFGRTYALQDANYNTTALVGARWMLEPELYPDIPNGWQVVERFVYNSYGQMTVFVRGYLSNTFTQANDNNHWNYTFQGMRYDPMTGLLFSQTRPYDPDLGIWLSQDIFYFDGPNLYGFVTNNPINGLDPTGMDRYRTSAIPYPHHTAIVVDKWVNGKRVGVIRFDFATGGSQWWWLTSPFLAPGQITELNFKNAKEAFDPDPIAKTYKSTEAEDAALIKELRDQAKNPPLFSGIFYNCQWWTLRWIDYRGTPPATIVPTGAAFDAHSVKGAMIASAARASTAGIRQFAKAAPTIDQIMAGVYQELFRRGLGYLQSILPVLRMLLLRL